MVTHPCTNRAQRCLISILRRNHHNTTPHSPASPNHTKLDFRNLTKTSQGSRYRVVVCNIKHRPISVDSFMEWYYRKNEPVVSVAQWNWNRIVDTIDWEYRKYVSVEQVCTGDWRKKRRVNQSVEQVRAGEWVNPWNRACRSPRRVGQSVQ